jgi:hypothetical protein
MVFLKLDNAEKIRERSGADEYLLTSHKIGFRSKNLKNERISGNIKILSPGRKPAKN